jgi:hypothetical protein
MFRGHDDPGAGAPGAAAAGGGGGGGDGPQVAAAGDGPNVQSSQRSVVESQNQQGPNVVRPRPARAEMRAHPLGVQGRDLLAGVGAAGAAIAQATGTLINKAEIVINFLQVYSLILTIDVTIPWPEVRSSARRCWQQQSRA